MNVLLLTSPAPRSGAFSTSEKRPPLGVGTLIAILEQRGHTVLFDDQYLKPWPIFDTASFLRGNGIDFVGIYSNTICLQGTLSLARAKEQLDMAARARLQAFNALGCADTKNSLHAHNWLCHFAPLKHKVEILLLFEWAAQLRKANEERGIFCRELFNNLLLDRLISLAEMHPQFSDVTPRLLSAWPALSPRDGDQQGRRSCHQ